MIDLKGLQKDILANKKEKGFNITDIHKEFCYMYGEISEAFEAYRKKKHDLPEELADVAIYLLSLAEMLDINLEEEVIKKVDKNKKREYKLINGVNTRVSD